MNLPNFLTAARIVAIPVFILIYFLPFEQAHLFATILYGLACVTDVLDGYLARHLKLTTPLGAFLDPVADKLIVAVPIILVLGHGTLGYITLPSIIIIGREIAISALREWMAEIGKRSSVAVNFYGKLKTTLQMIAVGSLIFCSHDSALWVVITVYLLYYASAILTLVSMVYYFKAAWPELVRKKG